MRNWGVLRSGMPIRLRSGASCNFAALLSSLTPVFGGYNMHTCRRLLCAGLLCFAWPSLSIAQEADDRQQPPQQQSSGAQTAEKPEAAKAAADKPVTPDPEAEPPGGKRIFGVLPNYRTVDDNGVYTPITTSHKMHIAVKDSFDYPLFILGGALAALGQLTNQDPSFGQG